MLLHKKTTSYFLFSLFILSSQVYFWQSGIPQVSHFFLLAAYFLIASNISYKIDTTKALLGLFYLYALLINSIYSIIEESFTFYTPIIYLTFNLLIFNYINHNSTSKKFLNILIKSSIYAILILFLLSLLNIGRFDFHPRYNAFFNDPNQMSFWVICLTVCILSNDDTDSKIKFAFIIIAIFIITKAASRSGLIGLSTILIAFFLQNFRKNYIKISNIFLIIFAISIIALNFSKIISTDSVQYLISRTEDTDIAQQSEDRGFTRLEEFPEYLILGAGQAKDTRFGVHHEIHSTWVATIFYYGVIGLFILIATLLSIAINLRKIDLIYFSAPLIYSISTYGLRSPVFWVFLGYFYAKSKLELNK